ncbi:MAG: aminotransferase class IV [Blastochloris sp.]|nr:aminotransferase class IV [Blastochloris sp.]
MSVSTVSVEDQGFRWGLGVFESLRVKKGVALFHQMHLENITEAADALGLPMPEVELWKKAPEGEGVWRWYLTPQAQLTSWEAGEPVLPESYSLSLSPFIVQRASWEARYKTLSYLLRYQARKEVGTDEAVLLNENGVLASASMANLFWVKDGCLNTPSLECGCREGVLRRWIEESWAGKFYEGAFFPADLLEADEVFVTNSRIGVMPISTYGGRILELGSVTKELQAQHQETVMRELGVKKKEL